MPKREKLKLILPVESTDGAIRFDDGTVVEAQLAGKRITVEGAEVPYASKDEDRPPATSFRQTLGLSATEVLLRHAVLKTKITKS